MTEQPKTPAEILAELDVCLADAEAHLASYPAGRTVQDQAILALGLTKEEYAESRYISGQNLQYRQNTGNVRFSVHLQRDLGTLGALIARFAVSQANDPLPGTQAHLDATRNAQPGAPAFGTYDIAIIEHPNAEQLIEVEGIKRVTVGMYNQAMMIVAAQAIAAGKKHAFRTVKWQA